MVEYRLTVTTRQFSIVETEGYRIRIPHAICLIITQTEVVLNMDVFLMSSLLQSILIVQYSGTVIQFVTCDMNKVTPLDTHIQTNLALVTCLTTRTFNWKQIINIIYLFIRDISCILAEVCFHLDGQISSHLWPMSGYYHICIDKPHAFCNQWTLRKLVIGCHEYKVLL